MTQTKLSVVSFTERVHFTSISRDANGVIESTGHLADDDSLEGSNALRKFDVSGGPMS